MSLLKKLGFAKGRSNKEMSSNTQTPEIAYCGFPLGELSEDLLREIFICLDSTKEIFNCVVTCKKFNHAINHELFWKQMFLKQYGFESKQDNETWKEFFKSHGQFSWDDTGYDIKPSSKLAIKKVTNHGPHSCAVSKNKLAPNSICSLFLKCDFSRPGGYGFGLMPLRESRVGDQYVGSKEHEYAYYNNGYIPRAPTDQDAKREYTTNDIVGFVVDRVLLVIVNSNSMQKEAMISFYRNGELQAVVPARDLQMDIDFYFAVNFSNLEYQMTVVECKYWSKFNESHPAELYNHIKKTTLTT